MAEATLRAFGVPRFRAYSAGVRPVARLSTETLEFLASRRLPVAGLQPKSLMQFVAPHGPQLDFVITLSVPSIDMPTPDWKGSPVLARWNMDDDLWDMYWTLQRRIRIFTSLPHARLPRRAMEERVHALATWQ